MEEKSYGNIFQLYVRGSKEERSATTIWNNFVLEINQESEIASLLNKSSN